MLAINVPLAGRRQLTKTIELTDDDLTVQKYVYQSAAFGKHRFCSDTTNIRILSVIFLTEMTGIVKT